MVRKGSRLSASAPSTSRDSSSKQKTLIGGDAESLMLLLKNLTATMSAVVARLDHLEGAHFDARGPADFGATGSTTIKTSESVIKVCSSAQVSSSTGPSSAGDVPTAESEPVPPPAPAPPSPQTVVDYIGAPPCGTSIQLFKSSTVDSDYGSLALEKIVTVAVSSAVPSCLLLLTTKAALLKIQTFIRRCAVRLRLQNEGRLENVYITKSQVLCSVSLWFSIQSPPVLAYGCSASRCGSRHRGLRRPRCYQVASYSAPPRLWFRNSLGSKMVSWCLLQ